MPDPRTPGQTAYEAYRAWYVTQDPAGDEVWPEHAELERDDQAAWEAAAQAVRGRRTMTFDEKTALNAWAQERYDTLMQEGAHGHYETMFRVIHDALERREQEDDTLGH